MARHGAAVLHSFERICQLLSVAFLLPCWKHVGSMFEVFGSVWKSSSLGDSLSSIQSGRMGWCIAYAWLLLGAQPSISMDSAAAVPEC